MDKMLESYSLAVEKLPPIAKRKRVEYITAAYLKSKLTYQIINSTLILTGEIRTMAWTKYTRDLARDYIMPLSELRQEIFHLKQNRTFIRNLSLMSLTIIVSSISVADIYHHPYTIAKQEKCDQLFQAMSAAAVVKTYQIFY